MAKFSSEFVELNVPEGPPSRGTMRSQAHLREERANVSCGCHLLKSSRSGTKVDENGAGDCSTLLHLAVFYFSSLSRSWHACSLSTLKFFRRGGCRFLLFTEVSLMQCFSFACWKSVLGEDSALLKVEQMQVKVRIWGRIEGVFLLEFLTHLVRNRLILFLWEH